MSHYHQHYHHNHHNNYSNIVDNNDDDTSRRSSNFSNHFDSPASSYVNVNVVSHHHNYDAAIRDGNGIHYCNDPHQIERITETDNIHNNISTNDVNNKRIIDTHEQQNECSSLGRPGPRPYIRSPLVRAMYEKIQHESFHRDNLHTNWYTVNTSILTNPHLSAKFIQFHQDSETERFLNNCFEKSDWIFTQLYHVFAKAILTWFMPVTSVNGWLGRGSMFVFSSSQIKILLDIQGNIHWDANEKSLLDIGAGDGNITKVFEPFFSKIFVTETSSTMKSRLKDRGYLVLDVENWNILDGSYDGTSSYNSKTSSTTNFPTTPSLHENNFTSDAEINSHYRNNDFNHHGDNDHSLDVNNTSSIFHGGILNDDAVPASSVLFDVISCLNVIDRCDKPITLLRKMRIHLKPNGRLILALVLPIKQYVEFKNLAITKNVKDNNSSSRNNSFLSLSYWRSGSSSRQPSSSSSSHEPEEIIETPSMTAAVNEKEETFRFEKHLEHFVHHYIEPLGFIVEKFTRLPYLCEGDLHTSFYVLNDLILVLRRVEDSSS